ncbi:hypothetical protein [Kitasatospora sp. NPDC017646]|uniref:hypothetical protein n=1 Tax=Kitasatospora sp. NPDC017646 TaxID=3364024 RepID=UPI0037AA5101
MPQLDIAAAAAVDQVQLAAVLRKRRVRGRGVSGELGVGRPAGAVERGVPQVAFVAALVDHMELAAEDGQRGPDRAEVGGELGVGRPAGTVERGVPQLAVTAAAAVDAVELAVEDRHRRAGGAGVARELDVLGPALVRVELGPPQLLIAAAAASVAAVDEDQAAVEHRRRRVRRAGVGRELGVLVPALASLEHRPPQVEVLGGTQTDRDEHRRRDPWRDQLAAIAPRHRLDPGLLGHGRQADHRSEGFLEELADDVRDEVLDLQVGIDRHLVQMDLEPPPLRLERHLGAQRLQLLAGARRPLHHLQRRGGIECGVLRHAVLRLGGLIDGHTFLQCRAHCAGRPGSRPEGPCTPRDSMPTSSGHALTEGDD